MERTYFTDKDYEKINFAETSFPIGDYENCKFINCNFLNNGDSGESSVMLIYKLDASGRMVLIDKTYAG